MQMLLARLTAHLVIRSTLRLMLCTVCVRRGVCGDDVCLGQNASPCGGGTGEASV